MPAATITNETPHTPTERAPRRVLMAGATCRYGARNERGPQTCAPSRQAHHG
jgi:hypothetical protein